MVSEDSTNPMPYIKISSTQYQGDEVINADSNIVSEHSLTLTVNGQEWLNLMCTPQLLEELALGFLFNEGVIEKLDEVELVDLCPDKYNIDIWLNHPVKKPENWSRTSGCSGGMTSTPQTGAHHLRPDDYQLPYKQIPYLMDEFLDSQHIHRASGGIHSSAASDGRKIVFVVEDIGRHNTLDKLAGLYLKNPGIVGSPIILTTGRISSEMLLKTLHMQAPILISRTSPTSLSIQMAEEYGVTLIGYARSNRFTVYTHSHRIQA
jgi:FdhD protein